MTDKITFDCVKVNQVKETLVLIPKKYKAELIEMSYIHENEIGVMPDGTKYKYKNDDILILKHG